MAFVKKNRQARLPDTLFSVRGRNTGGRVGGSPVQRGDKAVGGEDVVLTAIKRQRGRRGRVTGRTRENGGIIRGVLINRNRAV